MVTGDILGIRNTAAAEPSPGMPIAATRSRCCTSTRGILRRRRPVPPARCGSPRRERPVASSVRPVFAGQIDGHAVVDPEHYERFRKLLQEQSPDAVFTHWPIDNHADHRAMFNLVYDAWIRLGRKFALYFYEVSTGRDTVQFSPTDYVDITATAARKRKACYAHASQSPIDTMRSRNPSRCMRGLESGSNQAEAFVRHVQSPPFPLPPEAR